ncbi:hypothetical protein PPERSA_11017 [Pseudocohnilembus persalinus]|uniref:Uncharacterized protein n=1 Tax=Pseudocohnilembus persalinus TaxID=266149 RepID=A0A0V0QYS7_PSEPJ|nr:hypothetical protein PPERSA_11017 [Pseudocohnilembus persalinus]|eukprot:KRX07468.1 hypothetical protein PPERSA_11017 [Pseudocohnilembus persalinus]
MYKQNNLFKILNIQTYLKYGQLKIYIPNNFNIHFINNLFQNLNKIIQTDPLPPSLHSLRHSQVQIFQHQLKKLSFSNLLQPNLLTLHQILIFSIPLQTILKPKPLTPFPPPQNPLTILNNFLQKLPIFPLQIHTLIPPQIQLLNHLIFLKINPQQNILNLYLILNIKSQHLIHLLQLPRIPQPRIVQIQLQKPNPNPKPNLFFPTPLTVQNLQIVLYQLQNT